MPRRRFELRAAFLVASAATFFGAIVSCATAGGEVSGGGLTEAGARATNPPAFDSGRAIEEPVLAQACSLPAWRTLYEDVFSPVGKPGSCAFNETCHGTPEGAGARSGTGPECYDERGCCRSMFEKRLVELEDTTAPDRSGLFLTLRRRVDGGTRGFMPKEPRDYVYPEETLELVRAWIRQIGAAAAPEDAGLDAGDAGPDDAGDTGDASDAATD
jgi:hypothetical protein